MFQGKEQEIAFCCRDGFRSSIGLKDKDQFRSQARVLLRTDFCYDKKFLPNVRFSSGSLHPQ